MPKFEMIFLKKIINKVSSQAIFRIGYLSAISDRTSTEIKNAQVWIGPIIGPSRTVIGLKQIASFWDDFFKNCY